MKPNIATANGLTRGQESAVLIKIAEQLGIEDIHRAIELFLRGKIKINIKDVIDWLGTTKTVATNEKFIANKKFVINTSNDALVKISYMCDTFRSLFLSDQGKIEDPLGEQKLRYGKLNKDASNIPIIDELGGEVKAEITLTEVFDLMLKQPNGEEGNLSVSQVYYNIFYVRNIHNGLWSISVYWDGKGWRIKACNCHSVTMWGWGARSRVFSRIPVLELYFGEF